jgi:hypothetical protein
MEPRARVIRDRQGRERVVLDLADFQALLDASEGTESVPPDLGAVVRKLGQVLEGKRDDVVDLDEFLADYDAAHGAS